ncbi:MAG: isopeptide-forming domain-containing fimbrial protein, partial [Clostridia bacterium]|nr:isopeptide-forming domain-containing fimbrial protein [Clostridia bacterium]
QAVHKDIKLGEEIEYDILAYVPTDATEFTITDNLNENLDFLNDATHYVTVSVLDNNNHYPAKDIRDGLYANPMGEVATVAVPGSDITADATNISTMGQLLTVTFKDADQTTNRFVTDNLRGKWVRVKFFAQIKESIVLDVVNERRTIDSLGNIAVGSGENAPVEYYEGHSGIPNKAEYIVNNDPAYRADSNTVTVTPEPEKPEIEKYVNKSVAQSTGIEEVMEFDVIAYVPTNADEITISDELVPELELLVGRNHPVSVYRLGARINNLPVNNTDGTVIEYQNGELPSVMDGELIASSIDGKTADKPGVTVDYTDNTLSVTIANNGSDASGSWQPTLGEQYLTDMGLRGRYVRVNFSVQLNSEVARALKNGTKKAEDFKNIQVLPNENGNISIEAGHSGIPNEAYYSAKVGNTPLFEVKSNATTVKPTEENKTTPGKSVKTSDDRRLMFYLLLTACSVVLTTLLKVLRKKLAEDEE